MKPVSAPANEARDLLGELGTDDLRVRPSESAPRVDRREVSRKRDALFRRSLAVADMTAVALAVLGAVALDSPDSLMPLAIAVPLVFVAVVKAMGLYDRDEHLLHKSTLDEIPALFSIASLAVLLLWLANDFFVDGALGRSQVLFAWATLLLLAVCLRALARACATRVAPVERCLLVGDPFSAQYIREKLALSHAVKAELIGVVPAGERDPDGTVLPPPDLSTIVDEHAIERVILDTRANAREDLLYTIRELKTSGVKVSVLPDASRVAGSSVELDHLHGITLLGMRRFEFTRSSRLVKRSFDLAGSVAGLIVLAPILLVVAVAIRIDSRGPVVFRQRRVGRHGDEFRMLKFRSMVTEADQMKDELRTSERAPPRACSRSRRPPRHARRQLHPPLATRRAAPAHQRAPGRDEPGRTPPADSLEEDRQIEGWYRRRLDVPPGMTGHWQILGSSARIPIDEMVKLDYLYVANWSLWGDIRLLLRTVPFVFGRKGV